MKPVPEQFSPIDLERLIRFFENLFAHALTLQEILEMIQSHQSVDDQTYSTLKGKYDIHAAQQFDMFYSALKDPEGFAKACRDFLNVQPTIKPN
jgi:hypothetical protein